jgi:hypothetical protein
MRGHIIKIDGSTLPESDDSGKKYNIAIFFILDRNSDSVETKDYITNFCSF